MVHIFRKIRLDVFLHCTLGGFATDAPDDAERRFLIRAWNDGLTKREIAEALGITANHAGVKLHKLRRAGAIVGRRKTPFSEEESARIVDLYAAGDEIKAIASALGRDTGTIACQIGKLRREGRVGRRRREYCSGPKSRLDTFRPSP